MRLMDKEHRMYAGVGWGVREGWALEWRTGGSRGADGKSLVD